MKSVTQCVECLTGNRPVSLNIMKAFSHLHEQETLSTLLSTGWFHVGTDSSVIFISKNCLFYNITKINWYKLNI